MLAISDSESYFGVLARAMRDVFYPCVDQIAAELLRAYHQGQCVYIFGNGGSASTASHFACDLSKSTIKGLSAGVKRFRVVALTDNVPLLTAWSNDETYEDVFAEQLRNLVRADDVVLAISGSGNSPNVLKALELARGARAHTIGLTGFQGGDMKALCRTCLVVPSDSMEVIEDVHMATCHAVATVIRQAIAQTRTLEVKETLSDTRSGDCTIPVAPMVNDPGKDFSIVEFPPPVSKNGSVYAAESGQNGD